MSLKKFLRTETIREQAPLETIEQYVQSKVSLTGQAPLETIEHPLKRRKMSLTGQASVEFFLLFAIVAVMTIVSISSFFSTTKTNTEGLFQKAVGVDGINIGNK